MFRFGAVGHPSLLTESVVPAWCGLPAANNTVRNRLSRLSTFLRWCVRHGQADPALVELLASRDKPLRQIPRLYGKVQASQPARRLTHPEAFERLVGACRDGTDLGRQDEAIIRLGLAGMRAAGSLLTPITWSPSPEIGARGRRSSPLHQWRQLARCDVSGRHRSDGRLEGGGRLRFGGWCGVVLGQVL
jgi:hypothetical protein